MDRWTHGTVVIDDRDSGGAGFYPGNWMGDVDDLKFEQVTDSPAGGLTCVRLTYTPKGPRGFAGIYWAYPDRNWGAAPGRSLVGATCLRGFLRGARGGERVELLIGGINRPPHQQAGMPFRDPFGPLPRQGRARVFVAGEEWQPFRIPIPRGTRLKGVIGGFALMLNKVDHPRGCQVFVDEVLYDNAAPGGLRLIRSFTPTAAAEDDPVRNAAFLYDNALALLWFLSCGDHRRARIIADTLVAAQTHDRYYKDGRWRNANCCGLLLDPHTRVARLPGVYGLGQGRMREDRYTVSTDTGNMAWAALALLSAHQMLEKGKVKPPHPYLTAARRAARWIEKNCRVDDALGGYSGGFEGWEKKTARDKAPVKLSWRSLEHSLDCAVLFTKLGAATRGQESHAWKGRARHARKFVLSMWNPTGQHFWVGVRDARGTLNKDAVAADCQTWALLALGHDDTVRARIKWAGPPAVPALLRWVEGNCRLRSGGGEGYTFSDKGKGIWPEGCAHVAACWRYLKQRERAEAVLAQVAKLSPVEKPAKPRVRGAGVPPSVGGILAAYPSKVETGFIKEFAEGVVGQWTYPSRPALGSTCWFLLAAAGVNPYWVEGPPLSWD
jgi:hypothetical protein